MRTSKLRTLFILQDLRCAGGQRGTLDLLRHLDRSKFEPTLFLLEHEGDWFSEVPQDVKVVFYQKSFRLKRDLLPYLAKIVVQARNSDVVIGALELHPTYLAYLAAALTRRPAIGWVRAPLDKWLERLRPKHSMAVKLLYPRLTRVVCVSRAVRQSVLKVAPVRPERLRVIYSPNDLDSIIGKGKGSLPDWAVDVFRKPTLIAVGRMSFEKGFDLLIRAHAKVLKKGIDHNLIIVGSAYPLRAELQDLVHYLEITDSVFMPGYVHNPYPLIKKASALVLSSRFEGLPRVIIEALALATPVVATACGGSIETLSEGKDGILVPPEDADGLADGMYRILSDGHLREKLSRPDIERLQCFSTENVIPQWEQLLLEIVS